MGRGSRHSKNAGTMGSEAMTYREFKGLGHGTVRERLGKVRKTCGRAGSVYMSPACFGRRRSILSDMCGWQDAIGNFYDCRLTLRPAVVRVSAPPWLNPHYLGHVETTDYGFFSSRTQYARQMASSTAERPSWRACCSRERPTSGSLQPGKHSSRTSAGRSALLLAHS